MNILDGKFVSKKIHEEIKQEVSKLTKKPCLLVILVGDDQASQIYVASKEKACKRAGILSKTIVLDKNSSQKTVIDIIQEANNDKNITGILVQMPIPKHLDSKKIQNRVDYLKDVDGLTDINAGRLMHNQESLIPCTPMGIMTLLEYYGIDVSGKNVTIVGRSDLVGKPLAQLMINNNATVTLCHSKTNNLSMHTKNADILLSIHQNHYSDPKYSGTQIFYSKNNIRPFILQNM